MNSFDAFTLAPMSAGDIIDRAIRLYRRNFLALLRIVLPPSLIAYLGLIIYYIGIRNFASDRGDARMILTISMILIGLLLWIAGKIFFYAVLGGASRALIHHLFDGTPLRARVIYRTVRERIWGLIGAIFMTAIILSGFSMIIYFIVIIMFLVFAALNALVISSAPGWFKIVFNVSFGVLTVLSILGLFLVVYSHVVYIPQVMMVEGKGVFSSIGRSFSLAGGEVKRVAAVILFWFYVAWSIWLLLMIPLGWYGYWVGVDFNPFRGEEPVWYSIAQQTLTQVSEILIAPIAMLGFTLLYLDCRVRKEGFDVELLANRILPPPPEIPHAQPSYAGASVMEQPRDSIVPSIFGLNDYSQIRVRPGSDSTSMETEASRATAAGESESNSGDPVFDVISIDPVETEIVAEAPGPGALAGEAEPVIAPIQEPGRSCRWCGSRAGDEDRFCRVCGSVF